MAIRVTTLGDLVDEQAERTDGDALVIREDRLTYPELAAETDRFAAGLHALGIRYGDKVGILMPNSPDYVAALVGAAKLGAVAVPINGRFKVHELAHVISHADLALLVVSSDPDGVDYTALVSEVLPGLADGEPGRLTLPEVPALRVVVDLQGSMPGSLGRPEFDAAAASVTREEVKLLQQRVRVRDAALLMYTSGTTARPKGCLLSHEAVVRQAEAVARTRFMLTPDDALWDPLPMFHCGGIVPMLGCFSTGAKYCHPGFFTPAETLKSIQTERCTVLYPAFETIWLAVLDHPDFPSTDLSAVRLIQNIATPERLAQFEARMPQARQVSSYGSTECATNLTLTLPDDPYEIRMRTLGRPVGGMEIKIVDPESHRDLPEGAMGELCFRGYSMFDGYYKDPEQTAAAIDAEGWFHTGDRAMLVDGGNLVYGGRIKDMLKVGGENVAAVEIEDYLVSHPAVGIAQVVGAPDARYQEVPAAFIQPVPGASLTETEIVRFCRGSIASYKIPRYVRFVTEWPMSGTKIQKFVLRDRITKELEELGITEAPTASKLGR
ncbi:AMP-binding protein [Actinomadura rugatobispora]|uniref:AMP-binding protein n=1 Tax=Actinomadura rugatobispora TaxID=1994 RepID=A0ABW0ZZ43_9ACTN|nr:class I adenylate-forming enzyme family protein [Actinomadura rugatobispora]